MGIRKSINIQQTAKDVKEGIKEYSKRFEFELDTPDQMPIPYFYNKKN